MFYLRLDKERRNIRKSNFLICLWNSNWYRSRYVYMFIYNSRHFADKKYKELFHKFIKKEIGE